MIKIEGWNWYKSNIASGITLSKKDVIEITCILWNIVTIENLKSLKQSNFWNPNKKIVGLEYYIIQKLFYIHSTK